MECVSVLPQGALGCTAGVRTYRLVKVRKYRGMRTPTGIRTRKAMAASRPWSLTLFSYSESPLCAKAGLDIRSNWADKALYLRPRRGGWWKDGTLVMIMGYIICQILWVVLGMRSVVRKKYGWVGYRTWNRKAWCFDDLNGPNCKLSVKVVRSVLTGHSHGRRFRLSAVRSSTAFISCSIIMHERCSACKHRRRGRCLRGDYFAHVLIIFQKRASKACSLSQNWESSL